MNSNILGYIMSIMRQIINSINLVNVFLFCLLSFILHSFGITYFDARFWIIVVLCYIGYSCIGSLFEDFEEL
jgi:hypothetical protein